MSLYSFLAVSQQRMNLQFPDIQKMSRERSIQQVLTLRGSAEMVRYLGFVKRKSCVNSFMDSAQILQIYSPFLVCGRWHSRMVLDCLLWLFYRNYRTFYNHSNSGLILVTPYKTDSYSLSLSLRQSRDLRDLRSLLFVPSCSLSLRERMGMPVTAYMHLQTDSSLNSERRRSWREKGVGLRNSIHWLLTKRHASVFSLLIVEDRMLGMYFWRKEMALLMVQAFFVEHDLLVESGAFTIGMFLQMSLLMISGWVFSGEIY